MSCTCNGLAAPLDDRYGCSGGESFALRVLGDDMSPEFNHGDIIVIEPDGALHDGCFVLAPGGWPVPLPPVAGARRWLAVARAEPRGRRRADLPLADLEAVRGLVIQKAVPGRRRLSKSYLPARR
jgi:DNA polymerase V